MTAFRTILGEIRTTSHDAMRHAKKIGYNSDEQTIRIAHQIKYGPSLENMAYKIPRFSDWAKKIGGAK